MLEHRMELFACRASKNFAAKVIDEMNGFLKDEKVHLGSSEVTMFSDGEFQPAYTACVARRCSSSSRLSLRPTI